MCLVNQFWGDTGAVKHGRGRAQIEDPYPEISGDYCGCLDVCLIIILGPQAPVTKISF